MIYRLLAVAFIALFGMALAKDQEGEAVDRLRQLRRDLPMIQVLVDQGLELAAEEDPVKRAQTCNVLAESLVKEIRQAAAQKDKGRSAVLGTFLQAVLARGVADNLDQARRRLPHDSPSQAELKKVSDRMLRVTQPVAEPSQSGEQQFMKTATEAANQGRQAVEKALGKKIGD